MIKRLKNLIQKLETAVHFLPKMSSVEISEMKRPADVADKDNNVKKAKLEATDNKDAPSSTDKHTRLVKKRKVAVIMAYSGKGYFGMQRNKGFKTIEEDLLNALLKAELITQDFFETPQQMQFQRAARTDKGVSACMNVVSLKMDVGKENPVEMINKYLPDQIRVFGVCRTTNGFNSKNKCDRRTYKYITPSFAFAPVDQIVKEDYRITDDVLNEVNSLLQQYKGTHNFHNFTSGKKATDRSAMRYMLDLQCSPPFVRDSLEFVVISITGQSFMLHQIRKMIGLAIAIMRGLAPKEMIQETFGKDKRDVPKAPGLGLMLQKIHYHVYNEKYQNDGIHDRIDYDCHEKELDKFTEDFIYPTIVETEKAEKSMLTWMDTLTLHDYEKIIELEEKETNSGNESGDG